MAKRFVMAAVVALILAVTAKEASAFCLWWMEPCDCSWWWECP